MQGRCDQGGSRRGTEAEEHGENSDPRSALCRKMCTEALFMRRCVCVLSCFSRVQLFVTP